MARWHTSSRFNAKHIILQSGKFHLSKPQFYHSAGSYLMGRLPGPLYVGYSNLECEFESERDTLTFCVHLKTPPLVLHQPSSLPSDRVYSNISFGGDLGIMCKCYGELAHLFFGHRIQSVLFDDSFRRQFQAILASGADFNQFMTCKSGVLQLTWRERWLFSPNVYCYDILLQVFCRFL